MRNNSTRTAIAVFTLLCFLWSSVFSQSFSSFACGRETAKGELFRGETSVPASLGRVTGARYFGGDRVVITIQDLHCHPDVQREIASILKTLDERYHLKKVYVEGGTGPIDTGWVKLIHDKKVRNETVEALVDTGRLTGVEYYSIRSGKYDLLAGLEDGTVHEENIRRLGDILAKREAMERTLQTLKADLDGLEERYFGAGNKRLARLIGKNREGKLSSEKYFKELLKLGKRAGVDGYEYQTIAKYLDVMESQKKLNNKKISQELQEYLLTLKTRLPYRTCNELFKKANDKGNRDEFYGILAAIAREYDPDNDRCRPHLAAFFRYRELSGELDSTRLVRESRSLVRELHDRLATTGGEKEAAFIGDYFGCLEEYLENRITAEDYEYFCRNLATFKGLWPKYMKTELAPLEPYFELLDEFYRVNVERNRIFLKNAGITGEWKNETTGIAPAVDHVRRTMAALKDAKDVTVLVTGGFHTDGVSELLKEKGISFLVITPNAGGGHEYAGAVYDKLAKEQARTATQTIALKLYSQILREKPGDLAAIADAKQLAVDKLELMYRQLEDKDPEAIAAAMDRFTRRFGARFMYNRSEKEGKTEYVTYTYANEKEAQEVTVTYNRETGKVDLSVGEKHSPAVRARSIRTWVHKPLQVIRELKEFAARRWPSHLSFDYEKKWRSIQDRKNRALEELYRNSAFKTTISADDRKMGLIDVHMHTATGSDGAVPVEEQIQRAVDAGIRVLQVTDHDSVAGLRRAMKKVDELNKGRSIRNKVVLIPAVEITLDRKLSLHFVASNIDIEKMDAFFKKSGKNESAMVQAKEREQRFIAALSAAKKRPSGFTVDDFDIAGMEKILRQRRRPLPPGFIKKSDFELRTGSIDDMITTIQSIFDLPEGAVPDKARLAESILRNLLTGDSYRKIVGKLMPKIGKINTSVAIIALLGDAFDPPEQRRYAIWRDAEADEDALNPADVFSMVHEQGGKVIFAHPLRNYNLGETLTAAMASEKSDAALKEMVLAALEYGTDPGLLLMAEEIRAWKAAGLDGISTNYYYAGVGKSNDFNRIARIIAGHLELPYLPSGETDCHGPIHDNPEYMFAGKAAGVPYSAGVMEEFKRTWFALERREAALKKWKADLLNVRQDKNRALQKLHANSTFKTETELTTEDQTTGGIDAHMHSFTGSDGAESVEEQIDAAVAAGIRVIQITEHDSVASLQRAIAHVKKLNKKIRNVKDRIVLVPAVEVTVERGYHVVVSNIDMADMALILGQTGKLKNALVAAAARRESLIRKIERTGFTIDDFDFDGLQRLLAGKQLSMERIGLTREDFEIRKDLDSPTMIENINEIFKVSDGALPSKSRIGERTVQSILTNSSFKVVTEKLISGVGRINTSEALIVLLGAAYNDEEAARKAIEEKGVAEREISFEELAIEARRQGAKLVFTHPFRYFDPGPVLTKALDDKINDEELESIVRREMEGSDQGLTAMVGLVKKWKEQGLDGISINYHYEGSSDKKNNVNRVARIVAKDQGLMYSPAGESDCHGAMHGDMEYRLVGKAAGIPRSAEVMEEFKRTWFALERREAALMIRGIIGYRVEYFLSEMALMQAARRFWLKIVQFAQRQFQRFRGVDDVLTREWQALQKEKNEALEELYRNSSFKTAITDADRETGLIDLHMHDADGSDGTNSVREQIEEAVKKGVRVLQITNHDSVASLGEAVAVVNGLNEGRAVEDRVVIIPAVEAGIVTRDGRHSIHYVASNIHTGRTSVILEHSGKHRNMLVMAETRKNLLLQKVRKGFKSGDFDLDQLEKILNTRGLSLKSIRLSREDFKVKRLDPKAMEVMIRFILQVKPGATPVKSSDAEKILQTLLTDDSYEDISGKITAALGRNGGAFTALLGASFDNWEELERALLEKGTDDYGMTAREFIRKMHAQGAKVVLAHPMRYFPLEDKLTTAMETESDAALKKLVIDTIYDGTDPGLNKLVALIRESEGLDGISTNYFYAGIGMSNNLNRIARILAGYFGLTYLPAGETDDHGPIHNNPAYMFVGKAAGVPRSKEVLDTFLRKWSALENREKALKERQADGSGEGYAGKGSMLSLFNVPKNAERTLRRGKTRADKGMIGMPLASVIIDLSRYPGGLERLATDEAIRRLSDADMDTVVLKGLPNTMNERELRRLSRVVKKLHKNGKRVVTDYALPPDEIENRVLANVAARMHAGTDGIRPDFRAYEGNIIKTMEGIVRTALRIKPGAVLGVLSPGNTELRFPDIYRERIRRVIQFLPGAMPDHVPQGSWLEMVLEDRNGTFRYEGSAGDFDAEYRSLLEENNAGVIGLDYEILDEGMKRTGIFRFRQLYGTLLGERSMRRIDNRFADDVRNADWNEGYRSEARGYVEGILVRSHVIAALLKLLDLYVDRDVPVVNRLKRETNNALPVATKALLGAA